MDGPFGVLSIGDDKAGYQAEIGHVNHVHPSFDAIKLISEGRGNQFRFSTGHEVKHEPLE